MKNKTFKKSISVFLSVLMILSCWVWTPGEHNQVSAVKKGINLSALSVITDGSGSRADSSKIVICSDGRVGNTTVGILKFNISDIPATITNATLRVNVGNHGGYIPSYANFYLVDPSNCTDATSIGQVINNISSVYSGSYSGVTGANNARSYFGITDSALGTVHQNVTGINSFTITDAVKTARTNGWSQLCLVFIMPQAFSDNGSTGWSDLHIYTFGTTLSCEYPSENAIAGNYYIRYMVNVTSVSNNEKDYNLYVSYKTNNGKGNLVTNEVLFDRDSMDYGNADDYVLYEGYINGFPTELYQHMAFPSAFNNERQENFRMYIGSDPDNLTSYSIFSTSGNNFTYKNSEQDNKMLVQSNFEPYQSSIVGMSALSISVGKDGKGQSATTIGEVRDQYGVSWYEAPTYTVSSSSTSQSNVSGVSVVTSGAGAYVKVDNLANVTGYNPSTGTATVYLRATSGSASVSVPVTITSPKFNMTFNSPDDATTIAAKQFNYAQPIGTTLPVPTRPGYTFKGWWIDLDGNGVQNGDEGLGDPLAYADGTVRSDLQNYPITSDLSLISVWEQNTFDITFNFANGTTNTQTYVPGTTITAPANTTKNPDATNHYIYTWSPTVSTTVTGNATYTEVLEVEAHKWSEWTTTSEPSCTAEGEKQRSCNVCGYVETGTVGMAAHTEEVIPAVDATCTSTGLTAGKKCSVCDTIIVAQTVVPMKSHSFTTYVPNSDATCTNDGTKTAKCDNCSATDTIANPGSKLDHDMGDWITDTDPTCITAGTKHRDCKNCDYSENGTIDPTGVHVYGEWSNYDATQHRGKCTKDPACTAYVTEAHTASDLAVKYNDTYHHYKCEKCEAYGAEFNGSFIANAKEACYEEGVSFEQIDGNNSQHKETCICGNTKNDYHALVKVDGTYVAPTCIATGKQGWKCTECNYEYTETLSKVDHTYGEWIDEVPATCIKTGTKGHYECGVCGDYFDADKNAIDDLVLAIDAATHTKLVMTGAKSETCTTAGNIEYWTCEGCGKIYSDANAETEITAEDTVIGVIAHNWISTAVESELEGFTLKSKADCVHKAVYYRNCSICKKSALEYGVEKTFEYGDAKGHVYGDWANDGVNADHTGTHTKTCTVCLEADGFDGYKVTKDHSWDAGVVTTEPSYTAAGVKKYTCTECQTTYEEAIPANEDTIKPTVSIKWGEKTWYSILNTITFGTYVNYNIELEITASDAETGLEKTEYLVSNEVISDITTATGWTEYDETDKLTISKADEANYVVYARATDKKGNVAYASTDGFVIDTTEPVVTVTGAGANGIYCSDVTVKVEEEHLLMFRLNNAAYPIGEDGEITLSNGSYSIVVTDEAGNETAVVFTVLGEHDYEALEGEANTEENFAEAATCTEAAKYYKVCSRCGDVNKDDNDTYSVGDALGHKYGEWIAEIPASCIATGTKGHYHCAVCDVNFDADKNVLADLTIGIDADAHTKLNKTDAKSVTCTTAGNIEYWTCEGCKKIYTEEAAKTEITADQTVIPATDHNWDEGAYLTEEDKPTCTEKGTLTYTCQNANCPTKTYTEEVEALGHKYGEWIAEIPASCIATGTKGHYHCAVCGVNFDADKNVLAELTIGVNAAAHTELNKTDAKSATCTTAGNIEYWTCEGCKKIYREEAATNEIELADTVISATGHTYDRKVADAAHMKSEATCESGTVYYYECSVCGEADRNDAYTWKDSDMLHHDFTGAWRYIVTAKQHQRKCSRCDAWTELEDCTFAESYSSITNEGDIHTHEALCECGNAKTEVCTAVKGETHEDPTCGDSSDYGWTDYSCALCSNEWEGDIVYVRHNLELKEKVDGDCVTKGYIIYECVNNGCPHEVRQELGFGTTHVGDAEAGTRVTIRDAKKATCSTEGYTGDTYCECGVKLVTGETIPVDGNAHQWGTPAIQPSTCVVAGFSIVYCDDCGEEKRTALELDPDAHMSVVTGVDTQPTCTEAGYTGATICEDCKTVINPGKPIPALGHKLSPWKIITMPSEDGKTPGYAERYCLRCGGERESRNDFYYNELYYVVYHNDNGVRLTAPRYYIEGDYTLRPEKNPTKAQDDKYTYEFIGWDYSDDELNFVEKQMSVIAQYKAIEKSYKVTFRDASGKVIPVEGIAGKDILFSEITKAYNGATPTKAATSDYRYEFIGWNISCDYETGEATVTPEFRQIPIEKEDEDSDGIFGWLIRWIKSILAKIGIVF